MEHAITYGLKVMEHFIKTKQIIFVRCEFCIHFDAAIVVFEDFENGLNHLITLANRISRDFRGR